MANNFITTVADYVDERTTGHGLYLPYASNRLNQDVERLRVFGGQVDREISRLENFIAEAKSMVEALRLATGRALDDEANLRERDDNALADALDLHDKNKNPHAAWEINFDRVSGKLDLSRTVGNLETARLVGLIPVENITGNLPLDQTSGDLDMSRVVGNLDLSRTTGNLSLGRTTGNLQISRITGELSELSGSLPSSRVSGYFDMSKINTGYLPWWRISEKPNLENLSGNLPYSRISGAPSIPNLNTIGGTLSLDKLATKYRRADTNILVGTGWRDPNNFFTENKLKLDNCTSGNLPSTRISGEFDPKKISGWQTASTRAVLTGSTTPWQELSFNYISGNLEYSRISGAPSIPATPTLNTIGGSLSTSKIANYSSSTSDNYDSHDILTKSGWMSLAAIMKICLCGWEDEVKKLFSSSSGSSSSSSSWR